MFFGRTLPLWCSGIYCLCGSALITSREFISGPLFSFPGIRDRTYSFPGFPGPGNDVYCRTTSAVATPECTICSVNVNVHIASISPGRPLIKRESESLPLASCFGYFTAANRTRTTTLVHHHFRHAFGRFLRSGDVMNGRNGSASRAVIRAMVACKVLSLMLRQCFVIGPTLGFADTVCRLG